MLTYLRARNLGVLEDVGIEPGAGFTVITGETGAGKTLLLGALRLLTGEKAKPTVVGPFAEEALSEGLFGEGESEVAAARVVPRSGKSRALIDGNLVSAAALAERVGAMVEIVGQHDYLRLGHAQSVLELVDAALDGPGREARRVYGERWARYRAVLDQQHELGGDRTGLERDLHLLRFQIAEIEAADLQPGDDQRMEAAASRLRSVEMLKENLGRAISGLESIGEETGEVVASLRKVATVDNSLEATVSRAEEVADLAAELLRSARREIDSVDEDPEALQDLEHRLTSLGELKRKYGRTVDEVLDYGSDTARRAAELEALLGKASSIDEEVATCRKALLEASSELHSARLEASRRVEAEAQEHLADLGLASATVHFEMQEGEPGASGCHRVDLLFASDERLVSGAIRETASGGELSRLVLALRLASRSEERATLVFDEVDAGVGGATALALGRKLADLSRDQQVLCVTHLPQVAAHAATHYAIERDGPAARVRLVEGDERLIELSRMLAGLPESERGREAAAELLQGAQP